MLSAIYKSASYFPSRGGYCSLDPVAPDAKFSITILPLVQRHLYPCQVHGAVETHGMQQTLATLTPTGRLAPCTGGHVVEAP